MRRALIAFLVLALAGAPGAAASSLPETRFGDLPGPPLLYERPPEPPELSVERPFQARPLLVSGTDAYRGGEYLYQDYLFDDHGADTEVPDWVTAERKPGPSSFSTSSGDVLYPTGGVYRHNAADLVELRVKPTPRAVLYRITLATAVDASVPAVGIGIDTDAGEGDSSLVEWDNGAGLRSPGLDLFVTAWDGGGELRDYSSGETSALPSGAVSLDPRTNQMTIRVPRRLADPGTATWRHFAGVGLWDGEAERFKEVRQSAQPTASEPASGNPAKSAPAIFNLAFRFDEPQAKEPQPPPGFFDPPPSTGPGTGNWYEADQAAVLHSREVRDLHADVDFGRLAGGRDGFVHRPGETQARILASALRLPEGVSEGFPQFGGRLQPYVLRVPGELGGGPVGLTFALHSLDGTYTQYAVFSPNQLEQFGDERGNVVATPLARGPDGWYTDEAEVDFFEVWRDVAHRFRLDPARSYVSGYSMGGYGTYKLGVEWPDLFARAFTTVGPPGRGIWLPPAPPSSGEVTNTHPLLENVRWVPYMNWVALEDELVPYPGPVAQQRRFDRLGLRSTLETFQGDHFTLAILDEWGAARDFLGNRRVQRRPSRVDYAFMPGADRPALGLVHDHAYWVSGLRARDETGDPQTDPARAEVSARSQAFGEGGPRVRRVSEAGSAGRPSPSLIQGTRWAGLRKARERNRLVLVLDNVGRARVDGRGAALDGGDPLRVRLESDGPGRVRLELPLPPGAVARRIEGGPVRDDLRAAGRGEARAAAAAPEVALDRRGATFTVASGEREYLIFVADRREGGGERGGAGPGAVRGRDAGGRAATVGAGSGAAGDRSGPGRLPFTGLALALLALAAAALLAAGRGLRSVWR